MVTVDKIRIGIITAVGTAFPDDAVYGEEIEQGLEEPCFFVKLLNATHAQALGVLYNRTCSFDVHYFGTSNKDRHQTAELLYELLEIVNIDGSLYRGINMNHEIVNDVLHFFVEYRFRVKKLEEPAEKMQSLEIEGGVKL